MTKNVLLSIKFFAARDDFSRLVAHALLRAGPDTLVRPKLNAESRSLKACAQRIAGQAPGLRRPLRPPAKMNGNIRAIWLLTALILLATFPSTRAATPKKKSPSSAKTPKQVSKQTSKIPTPVAPAKQADLWSLKPVVRPEVPIGHTTSTNPIDAFVGAMYREKGLQPFGKADKLTLLRRVYLDLTGLPPSPADQDAFLQDESPEAYEKVVDKLLASEQHGVRYARLWLDVLRYADADERMYAAPGIHLWRDWVIYALNSDMPYDQFVRTQLTGYRSTQRTQISNIGYRSKAEPRPDDLFARGFLSRGAVVRDNKDTQELPLVAVETVSTAFMGLTVGCAKCHDHMYDPISQRDFYRMKALFDPLVIKKITLASPADIMARAKGTDEAEARRAAAEGPLNELIAPYKQKLYEERLAMVPPEVQVIVRKPETQRTPAEQKIADDYFPVLRIDAGPIREILTPEDRKKYDELQRTLNQVAGRGRRGGAPDLPAFWTVEVDTRRETEPSYILTSGEPERPEKDKPVEPGWPFGPDKPDFREGRVEAFSDWLTAPENPLFARVAVNRLWQWHFGEGLQKSPSDYGKLGGTPSNPKLLDWLASEFVARKFSMKQMHKLIVTSETYRLASHGDRALMETNSKVDPGNSYLWSFRLRRLEAEPVWDSILSAANDLDLTVGGPSFDLPRPEEARRGAGFAGRGAPRTDAKTNRRGVYMTRGFSTSRDVVPNFLQSFDVEDGRLPCPVRTQTVTAPQALFLMNSDEVEKATAKLAGRLQKDSGGDLKTAVDLGYRTVLGRAPTASEKDHALTYLDNDPSRLKGLAWLLFNLDEFLYLQ
jgi:hypothetical protein